MPIPYNYKSNSSDRIHNISRHGLASSLSSRVGCSDSSLIPGLRNTSGTNSTGSPQTLRSILEHDDLLRSTFLDSPYRHASKPHPFLEQKHRFEPTTKSRSSPSSVKNFQINHQQSSRTTPQRSPQRSPRHSPQVSPRLNPTKVPKSSTKIHNRPASPATKPVKPPKIIDTSPCEYPPRIATETGAALMPKNIPEKRELSLVPHNSNERRFRRHSSASERRLKLSPKYLSECPKSNINWDQIDLEHMRLSFNPLTKETKLVTIDCPRSPIKNVKGSAPLNKKPRASIINIDPAPVLLENLPSVDEDFSGDNWSDQTKTAVCSPNSSTSSSPPSSPESTPSSSPTLIKDQPFISKTSNYDNHDKPKKWGISNFLSIFRSKSDSKLKEFHNSSKFKTSTNHENNVLPRPPNLVYESSTNSKSTEPSPRSSKRFSRQLLSRLIPKNRPLSVQ